MTPNSPHALGRSLFGTSVIQVEGTDLIQAPTRIFSSTGISRSWVWMQVSKFHPDPTFWYLSHLWVFPSRSERKGWWWQKECWASLENPALQSHWDRGMLSLMVTTCLFSPRDAHMGQVSPASPKDSTRFTLGVTSWARSIPAVQRIAGISPRSHCWHKHNLQE